MPTKTADQTTTPLGVDSAAYEEATKRIRDLNERLMESSKAAGLTTLDAYEKALKNMLDFEQKVSRRQPARLGYRYGIDVRGVRPGRKRRVYEGRARPSQLDSVISGGTMGSHRPAVRQFQVGGRAYKATHGPRRGYAALR